MTLRILPAPESSAPSADRLANAPHPREMLSLVGHGEAEAEFLDAYRNRRLHHAWLIGGEEGIGKATLAYRVARFLLANPDPAASQVQAASSLDVPSSHPAAHQIASEAHPDLSVIRRSMTKDGKSLRTEIAVEDVRKGLDVFTKTAAMGGYRISIVDACDDLNASSANALLKTLEEPPPQSLFLLVAHHPRRLLPTIRSRCRVLPMRPLSTEEVVTITTGLPDFGDVDVALHHRAAELSDGSVRRALASLDPKKLAFHDRLSGLLTGLPRIDGDEADTIAEQTAGRAGEDAFDRFCDLCERWLSAELARRGGQIRAMAPFAEVWTRFQKARREVDVYNLDRRPFVLATLADMADAARAR